MSGTYLDRIVVDVARRLDERRSRRPLSHLRALPAPSARPSFAEAIKAPGMSLIAEVKRASPSKGPIRPDLDVAAVVAAYERAGARAVSVLTEQDHFRGGLADLEAAILDRALGADRHINQRQDNQARREGPADQRHESVHHPSRFAAGVWRKRAAWPLSTISGRESRCNRRPDDSQQKDRTAGTARESVNVRVEEAGWASSRRGDLVGGRSPGPASAGLPVVLA